MFNIYRPTCSICGQQETQNLHIIQCQVYDNKHKELIFIRVCSEKCLLRYKGI